MKGFYFFGGLQWPKSKMVKLQSALLDDGIQMSYYVDPSLDGWAVHTSEPVDWKKYKNISPRGLRLIFG